MNEKQLRVGLYARISEDRDGQQTATARQMEDAQAMAARKGWEVADTFEDVDISAYNTRARRPEFERMLVALRDGELDGVVVWKLDRLTRQQRDLVRVMEACDAHKAFVASVMEPIDTRESYGQFVAELLVAQARMESANSSARQKRKSREQREQGRPPSTGRRCYGYLLRFTEIVPEEAAIIRDARDRVFAGENVFSICKDLESKDVRTTRGNLWRNGPFRRLLLSPTLAGQRVLDGKRLPGIWPPIISVEESLRLEAILNRRQAGTRRAPARKYLLTGMIRCGLCGGRMSAHARSDRARRYLCQKTPGVPRCGRLSTLAEPVDALVAELILNAVDDTALRNVLHARGQQDDGLVDAVRRDEERIETLSRDFYLDNAITREEFFAAREGLVKRLESNRAKLAQRDSRSVLGRFIGDGSTLRQAWDAGSLEWRRSVVGALLDHIEILPGRPGRLPFDPGRVRPVWRY